jgi:hypothetical protein
VLNSGSCQPGARVQGNAGRTLPSRGVAFVSTRPLPHMTTSAPTKVAENCLSIKVARAVLLELPWTCILPNNNNMYNVRAIEKWVAKELSLLDQGCIHNVKCHTSRRTTWQLLKRLLRHLRPYGQALIQMFQELATHWLVQRFATRK